MLDSAGMTNVFPSWHKPNLVLLVLRWGGCGYFWLVQILEKSWQGLLPWSSSKSKDVDGKSNGWNFQFNPHLPSSLWMLRASVVPSIYAAPAFVQCLTFVAFPDPPYGTESQLLSELTLDSGLMGCGFLLPVPMSGGKIHSEVVSMGLGNSMSIFPSTFKSLAWSSPDDILYDETRYWMERVCRTDQNLNINTAHGGTGDASLLIPL